MTYVSARVSLQVGARRRSENDRRNTQCIAGKSAGDSRLDIGPAPGTSRSVRWSLGLRSGLRLRYLRRTADILRPPIPRGSRQETVADAFSTCDLRFRIRSGETERLTDERRQKLGGGLSKSFIRCRFSIARQNNDIRIDVC